MTPPRRLAEDLPPVIESDYELSEQTLLTLNVFAAQAAPYEGCGIIHIDGSVTRFANISRLDRRHNFEMEADFDFEIPAFAIWHSHPGGRDFMSDSDHAGMHKMYQAGIKLPWVIVAHGEATIWELAE